LGGGPANGCFAGTKGPAILSKQKLVFVVDDDPGMLRGVRRLLREHGYDSVIFTSADAFQKHGNFEQGSASFSTSISTMNRALSCAID
jgi:DNA-binding NtrC family response regulator